MNDLRRATWPGLVALLFGVAASAASGQSESVNSPQTPRETLSLDQGWRFHLGDVPFTAFGDSGGLAFGPAKINDHDAKTGAAWGAAASHFNDTNWRQLDLPHDWAVEQPFDRQANESEGYHPRGIAWYRRQFRLDPADRGKNVELQFDGVAMHGTVWFNGSPVCHNSCGYNSFHIDITPMARYGNDLNTIAVRVDADIMEGWWYEGAGIYRHTWLVKRSPVHIVTDGVYANPVKSADGSWTIPVEATLKNSGRETAAAVVAVKVVDPDGKEVVGGRSETIRLDSLSQGVARLLLSVPAPRPWSLDRPTLYEVRTTVLSDNKPTDSVTTQCGFRTIRFDAKGFYLNDQPLEIQGVCCHQDHAGVGVAVPDSIWEFRLRKLKEMGVNAYRCAHNPPSKELLDLCDRMGILVMDETRHFNPAPEYMAQLEWLVRRDRNHPSVILWSLFNEEKLQDREEGVEISRYMNTLVKRLDSTRYTTGAQNMGQLGRDGKANPQNAAQVVDVVGVNYQADKYDQIRAAYPDKPIISSEDGSQVSTRGEFFTDRSRNTVSSYDDRYQNWQSTNRSAWTSIAQHSSFAGGFLWTGFDYRGEPSPYGWPSVSSYFGSLDSCGFPKTGFYIRQAFWVHDKPVLALVPHWNWAGREGQPIKVRVLTNADTVALSLNGQLIEEKKVDPFEMADWQVPYAPGKLEAVAKKDGQEVSRCFVETTGEPTALRLTPDRTAMAGDGEDAVPVTVEALDNAGRPVPTANLAVEFEISGPGAIIGLGNGDPTSHEPDKGNKRSLFNGLAQVILQSQRGNSGNLVLRAKAEGLKPAETIIGIKEIPLPPSVPVLAKQ
jgi:beta-galactosidase